MGKVIPFTRCYVCIYLRSFTKLGDYECSDCTMQRIIAMEVEFGKRRNRFRGRLALAFLLYFALISFLVWRMMP
jgi:hypothetical protein